MIYDQEAIEDNLIKQYGEAGVDPGGIIVRFKNLKPDLTQQFEQSKELYTSVTSDSTDWDRRVRQQREAHVNAIGKEYDCPQGCGRFILGETSCLVGVLIGSHHPDFPHHCHEHDTKIETSSTTQLEEGSRDTSSAETESVKGVGGGKPTC